jgi:hypothetical protein
MFHLDKAFNTVLSKPARIILLATLFLSGCALIKFTARFFDILSQRCDLIGHFLFGLLFYFLFKGAFARHFNHRLDILPFTHAWQPVGDRKQIIKRSLMRPWPCLLICNTPFPLPAGHPDMSCEKAPIFLCEGHAGCLPPATYSQLLPHILSRRYWSDSA